MAESKSPAQQGQELVQQGIKAGTDIAKKQGAELAKQGADVVQKTIIELPILDLVIVIIKVVISIIGSFLRAPLGMIMLFASPIAAGICYLLDMLINWISFGDQLAAAFLLTPAGVPIFGPLTTGVVEAINNLVNIGFLATVPTWPLFTILYVIFLIWEILIIVISIVSIWVPTLNKFKSFFIKNIIVLIIVHFIPAIVLGGLVALITVFTDPVAMISEVLLSIGVPPETVSDITGFVDSILGEYGTSLGEAIKVEDLEIPDVGII